MNSRSQTPLAEKFIIFNPFWRAGREETLRKLFKRSVCESGAKYAIMENKLMANQAKQNEHD
jgi:hypothetical protein